MKRRELIRTNKAKETHLRISKVQRTYRRINASGGVIRPLFNKQKGKGEND